MGIVTWPEVDNVWWIRHALDKQLNLIISIIEVKVDRVMRKCRMSEYSICKSLMLC